MNKVRDQIVFKKLEMKKVRSKQAALRIEIEREKKQLKSMTMLIDDFEVYNVLCIFFCAVAYRASETLILQFL